MDYIQVLKVCHEHRPMQDMHSWSSQRKTVTGFPITSWLHLTPLMFLTATTDKSISKSE